MRRRPRSLLPGVLLAGALLAIALLLPASGGAHPERITKFPYPEPGSVPAARSSGPAIVVCQRDSLSRLKRIYGKNRRALRPKAIAAISSIRAIAISTSGTRRISPSVKAKAEPKTK